LRVNKCDLLIEYLDENDLYMIFRHGVSMSSDKDVLRKRQIQLPFQMRSRSKVYGKI